MLQWEKCKTKTKVKTRLESGNKKAKKTLLPTTKSLFAPNVNKGDQNVKGNVGRFSYCSLLFFSGQKYGRFWYEILCWDIRKTPGRDSFPEQKLPSLSFSKLNKTYSECIIGITCYTSILSTVKRYYTFTVAVSLLKLEYRTEWEKRSGNYRLKNH